jgi:hypothetical protein
MKQFFQRYGGIIILVSLMSTVMTVGLIVIFHPPKPWIVNLPKGNKYVGALIDHGEVYVQSLPMSANDTPRTITFTPVASNFNHSLIVIIETK